jgi:hypothetical protein
VRGDSVVKIGSTKCHDKVMVRGDSVVKIGSTKTTNKTKNENDLNYLRDAGYWSSGQLFHGKPVQTPV